MVCLSRLVIVFVVLIVDQDDWSDSTRRVTECTTKGDRFVQVFAVTIDVEYEIQGG